MKREKNFMSHYNIIVAIYLMDSFMFKDAAFRDDSNNFKLSAPEPEMTNR